MRAAGWLCLIACTATPSRTPDAGLPDDVRPTRTGLVRGNHIGSSLVFKGIPYAAAAERWKPPQPAAPWADVRDALAFGPSCVQVDESGQVVGSEDCLSLNIWAPFTGHALPVMVFIHGGNNQSGCSCDTFGGLPYYDGQSLSEAGPAIVVTLNYRLAAFGFLADPAFATENALGSTGDYALRDQLAALTWVRDNIAAFGGDPATVMVFGHSAGSLNVAALIGSPLGAGLFSRAALHSGASVTVDAATVQRTWAAAEKAVGCDTATDKAACLREGTVEQIARVPGAVLGASNPEQAEFDPSVDPEVLPASPLQRVKLGQHNKVPMLIGTTGDEYAQLVDALITMPIVSDADYQAQVKLAFGDSFGATIVTHYPSSDYPSPREAFVAILNDVYMVCPTRLLVRALANAPGQPPLHRFIYTHVFPGSLAQYGAAHGFDVFELFHDVALVDGGAAETSLADAMARYWTHFAATGDPDPAWAPYDAGADSYLQLDWPIGSGAGARAAQCDFWETEGL